MTNKVENRREHNITSAAKNGDWTKVDKLLNQPIDNLERKKRYYGVTSLNTTVSNVGRVTELIDLYPDNTYNPVEQILIKERNKCLYNALSKLPEEELQLCN